MQTRCFVHIRQRLTNRRFQISLLWVCLVASFYLSPLRQVLSRETLTIVLPSFGPWSAFLFVALYAVAMVIGIPTVVLTIVGGGVFGLLPGTVHSVLGATVGAWGACWLSRYLLRPWAERRFSRNPTLQKFQRGIERQAMFFVIVVRLRPVTPFNIENYLFGLTAIRWQPYVLGTVVGIAPGTLAYSWVGATGADALQGGSAVYFLLAIGCLMALSILPMFISYWRTRKREKKREKNHD